MQHGHYIHVRDSAFDDSTSIDAHKIIAEVKFSYLIRDCFQVFDLDFHEFKYVVI